MTNYREILRLKAIGMNKQETAASIGCSRNTVAEVLRRASEHKLSYPLPEGLSDAQLAEILYPSAANKPVCTVERRAVSKLGEKDRSRNRNGYFRDSFRIQGGTAGI